MKRFALGLVAYLAGLVIAALVFEIALRFLPVPMGLYRTEDYQRWPLQNYEPHLHYTTSLGWDLRDARFGSSNNYGQLAPFDFRPGSHPVVVIGDSFVDSQMNWYSDTLQGQLGAMLGRPDSVYGLGANGLSVSDYLALAQMATGEFSPTAAVFLVIDGDVSESLLRQVGHYYFAVRDDKAELQYWPLYGQTFSKALRRTLGDSALYRYVELNLHFDPERLVTRAFVHSAVRSVAASQQRPMQSAEKQVIDAFLVQLPTALKLAPSCIALLFHEDTYAIVDSAAAVPLKDSTAVKDYFSSRARDLGFRVVDLGKDFRSDYARYGERLDHWPLDRHLNGRGHLLAAKAAYAALFSGGSECRPGRP